MTTRRLPFPTLHRFFDTQGSRKRALRGVSLLLAVAFTATVEAQTHRVAAADEHVTRAVAVYEWTGDLAKPDAARLIPVSLFIDGTLHDAGTYLSRPVPLALLTGNVYSLERAGVSQGSLDLDFARHITTANANDNIADAGWFGYGTFVSLQTEKIRKLKASATQPVLVSSKDTDEGPPSIKRPAHDTSAPKPTRTPRSTTPETTTPDSTPSDDPDRPTLRRHDTTPVVSGNKKGETASVTPVAGSLNDDPDRPTMQRGKPTGAAAAPAPLKGVPANLHQIAAVSDAANRDPHAFARDWDSPAEQAATLAAMQKLAAPLLEKYLHAAAPPPSAKSVPTHTSPHKRPTPKTSATPISLTNEDLQGFTLSYGGLPTFVYSATAPSTPTVATQNQETYITLIAQRLPSGELQVALTSITDAAHLDSAPQMRLVDAVDPDWEHRASLLFELRAHTSRQFALYRILSAQADRTFITQPVQ